MLSIARTKQARVETDVSFADSAPKAWPITGFPDQLTPFTPDEADKLIGSYWSLQQPVLRALKAILLRWRQIPKTEFRRQ